MKFACCSAFRGRVSFTLVLGAFCANAALESGFDNPPMEYRPGVFWEWCNGNINKAGITSDLEAMHRVGMQGGKVFNVSLAILM